MLLMEECDWQVAGRWMSVWWLRVIVSSVIDRLLFVCYGCVWWCCWCCRSSAVCSRSCHLLSVSAGRGAVLLSLDVQVLPAVCGWHGGRQWTHAWVTLWYTALVLSYCHWTATCLHSLTASSSCVYKDVWHVIPLVSVKNNIQPSDNFALVALPTHRQICSQLAQFHLHMPVRPVCMCVCVC